MYRRLEDINFLVVHAERGQIGRGRRNLLIVAIGQLLHAILETLARLHHILEHVVQILHKVLLMHRFMRTILILDALIRAAFLINNVLRINSCI